MKKPYSPAEKVTFVPDLTSWVAFLISPFWSSRMWRVTLIMSPSVSTNRAMYLIGSLYLALGGSTLMLLSSTFGGLLTRSSSRTL